MQGIIENLMKYSTITKYENKQTLQCTFMADYVLMYKTKLEKCITFKDSNKVRAIFQ